MIDLKPAFRISSLAFSLGLFAGLASADSPCPDGAVACGGDFSLTRMLVGASGYVNLLSTDRTLNLSFAFGEDIAGQASTDSGGDLVISGYFGGPYGAGIGGSTFHLVSATVSGPSYLQNGVQVGVPLNPTIQLSFSDNVDPNTLTDGIQLLEVTDHLGQSQNTYVPITFTIVDTTVTVVIQGSLSGNTLYEVKPNAQLLSIDGFSLNTSLSEVVPFVTLLNPQEQNVVLYPFSGLGTTSVLGVATPSIHLNIPSQSLSDYAAILANPDPMHNPVHVDPKLIEEANAKAVQMNGPYAVPVGLQELVGYNHSGQMLSALSQPTQFGFSFSSVNGVVGGAGSLVRSGTLALWALDTVHALWVKIPASQVTPDGYVTAPITALSVYALIGSPAGSASDVYVFPDPWRPHGPSAGTGSGQTGTESGGMTFNNLPSECTITLYTLSGRKVRTLQHSDVGHTIGQEVWDGKTSDGDNAASGVYFWRVESSVDGKNGKLMVIR